MTAATAVAPWGLSRMTDPLPDAPQLYKTVHLDPDTQITTFRDADGGIVDMADKATVTTSKGGGSDGSGGSANDS